MKIMEKVSNQKHETCSTQITQKQRRSCCSLALGGSKSMFFPQCFCSGCCRTSDQRKNKESVFSSRMKHCPNIENTEAETCIFFWRNIYFIPSTNSCFNPGSFFNASINHIRPVVGPLWWMKKSKREPLLFYDIDHILVHVCVLPKKHPVWFIFPGSSGRV